MFLITLSYLEERTVYFSLNHHCTFYIRDFQYMCIKKKREKKINEYEDL